MAKKSNSIVAEPTDALDSAESLTHWDKQTHIEAPIEAMEELTETVMERPRSDRARARHTRRSKSYWEGLWK